MTGHALPPAIGEKSLLASARDGDRSAFDALIGACIPRLTAVLRRMIGNPDDVADVLQQSLLKAWGALAAFRGEARFATWLQAIAMRQALDFLREKRRYRAGALLFAQHECERTGAAAEVMAIVAGSDFHFDAHEHIAYCFGCVGRSLAPELQAALLLREVYELSNDEAAAQLGVSNSVLRHRVAEARETMMDRYDRLCALVGKQGVCYQCEGLRAGAHEERRGPDPRAALGPAKSTREEKWRRRLQIVRDAPLGEGVSARLHERFSRYVDRLEESLERTCDADDIPTREACVPPGP